MSLAKSVYHATAVLNVMRGTTLTAFTPYLALMTTMPSADDGTGGVEASYASYARIALTLGAPGAGSSGSMQSANTNVVAFAAIAGGPITFAGVCIFDALSAGNLRYLSGTFTGGSAVPTGTTPRFQAGTIIVVED